MASAEVNSGLFASGNHWFESDWRVHLIEDNDERLYDWRPGDPLPEFGYRSHLAPQPKRIVQRILHGVFVRHLDSIRANSQPRFEACLIPDEKQRELGDALKKTQ